jgi:hypothetical protein
MGRRRTTMDGTVSTRGGVPAYVSYRTFLSFLESLRESAPARIDRSLLTSFSGTMQNQLLSALRYLGLIAEDGTTHPSFARLVRSEGTERRVILNEIVREAYLFLFGDFDLAAATSMQLVERFKAAGARGDTVRKCISFFLSIAEDAAIELSPFVRPAMNRTEQRTRRIRVTAMSRPERLQAPGPMRQATPETTRGSWHELLLAKFPSFDPAWPDDVKNKWFEAFERLVGMGLEAGTQDRSGIRESSQ